MKIIIIIIFTLCLISGQVLCFKVFGCTGGSLMFKCLYKSSHESDDRHKGAYFCRDGDCNTGITTENQGNWINNGRFSLYDDGNSGFIRVFIRNLSREDHGKYTCGKKKWSHDVELEVNSEPFCGKSVIQNGFAGKKITFRCEYEQEFKTLTKVAYRLKGGDPELMMNSNSRSTPSSEEKILLSDSQRDHFTVTIRSVSEDDDGKIYLCGVERSGSPQSSITHTTFIKEIHLKVSGRLTSVHVQADSGTSVFIKCTFPEELKKNSKFLQKGKSGQIFTQEQNRWDRHDKVQMFDDTSEGVLKVFITDLTVVDEGTYRCGVQKDYGYLITEVKLEVKQVDNFPASSEVSAVIGESVTFTCTRPVNPMSISHVCRQKRDEGICEGLDPSQQTRVQISESPAGETSVSFSNVSVRDAGVYWCGAETTDTHLTFISLSTKLELRLTAPPVVGREGDSVQIRCPYDPQHSDEVKHLCKGKCFTEDAQAVGRSDKDHLKETKISVNYDTRLGLFIATDLKADDAGVYCCTVKNCKEKKNKFNVSINLMIMRKDVSVGGSVSISCKHSTDQSLRVFCRGDQPNVCVRDGVRVTSDKMTNERFSMTDRSSAGVFTVNISNLTAEDSGKYWCAENRSGSYIFTPVHLNVREEKTWSDNSTENKSADIQPSETSSVLPVIATVSVGLILLTVCLVLVLFKRKHSRKEGASPDRRQTADTQDPASTALYSTIQSPTVPSDGLMYATVSFQKNEESVSDAKVTLNKEEIHCEYASVNHGITDN